MHYKIYSNLVKSILLNASKKVADIKRGGLTMTDREKAEVILEELDQVMSVDWNMKELYIKAIIKGIQKGKEV